MYECLVFVPHCCHAGELRLLSMCQRFHLVATNSVEIILTVHKVVPRVVTVVLKPGTWQQEIQYAYPDLLKVVTITRNGTECLVL